jgi:hypothetical protein
VFARSFAGSTVQYVFSTNNYQEVYNNVVNDDKIKVMIILALFCVAAA